MKSASSQSLPIRAANVCLMLALAASVAILTGAAQAKKQPKTYPEQGKVTATSVNEVPFRRTFSGPNGTSSVKAIRRTRTYTVETDSRTYVLDCGKTPPLFSSTPGECGGDKKIRLGDILHFRIEKGSAFIPAPGAADPAGEEKLRILDDS